ncbi:hypothetical protein M0Q50_02220 [bacterium]|jgi:hypothetical protein|nr:hypothetical protein [bacterium]
MKKYEKGKDINLLYTIIENNFIKLDKLEVKFNFIVYPNEIFHFYKNKPIYNFEITKDEIVFYIDDYYKLRNIIEKFFGVTKLTFDDFDVYIKYVINKIFNIKVDFIGNLDDSSIVEIINNINH